MNLGLLIRQASPVPLSYTPSLNLPFYFEKTPLALLLGGGFEVILYLKWALNLNCLNVPSGLDCKSTYYKGWLGTVLVDLMSSLSVDLLCL